MMLASELLVMLAFELLVSCGSSAAGGDVTGGDDSDVP